MTKTVKLLVLTSTLSAAIAAIATFTTLEKHPDLTPPDGVLVNGMQYHGELINGLLQGNAVLEDAAGKRTSGRFVDGLLQGEGTFSDGNGGQYTGDFVDGSFDGEGIYSYYNGDKYAGGFKKNAWHGKGEFTHANGDIYTGDFSDGFMHGEGSYVLRDGRTYTGRFEKNLFVEGKATAFGMILEGEFTDWVLQGKGKLIEESGATTEGEFSDGRLNGQGSQQLVDGSSYQGEFQDGFKHGKGTLTSANGDVYTGHFEYDRYHGEGELVLASSVDGIDKVSGEWRWGSLKNDPRDPRQDYSENIEKLLYSQNALLRKALDQVEASSQDSADLYFLDVAGYGRQDVFLKEIRYLNDYMQTYADQRIISLVNNHQTIDEFPLATRHSIAAALKGIEQKMDVENDILLLYMTSHGSKTHDFSINLNGLSLPPINPSELSEALKQTQIKWKVLVISACYSGGFINQLEDENTLVITAARNDRTSFGCGDDSDMTYFGRAYFQEALPTHASFVKAFYDAKEKVAEWEARDFPDAKPSLPQISIGKNIEKKLEQWQHPLGG